MKEQLNEFIGLPWDHGEIKSATAAKMKKNITKAEIAKYGETPRCAACRGDATYHTTACNIRFNKVFIKEFELQHLPHLAENPTNPTTKPQPPKEEEPKT